MPCSLSFKEETEVWIAAKFKHQKCSHKTKAPLVVSNSGHVPICSEAAQVSFQK